MPCAPLPSAPRPALAGVPARAGEEGGGRGSVAGEGGGGSLAAGAGVRGGAPRLCPGGSPRTAHGEPRRAPSPPGLGVGGRARGEAAFAPC